MKNSKKLNTKIPLVNPKALAQVKNAVINDIPNLMALFEPVGISDPGLQLKAVLATFDMTSSLNKRVELKRFIKIMSLNYSHYTTMLSCPHKILGINHPVEPRLLAELVIDQTVKETRKYFSLKPSEQLKG